MVNAYILLLRIEITILRLYRVMKNIICLFPVTRPALIFPSDPKVFIWHSKKNEILSYTTYPIVIGCATSAVIFEAVLLFKHLF